MYPFHYRVILILCHRSMQKQLTALQSAVLSRGDSVWTADADPDKAPDHEVAEPPVGGKAAKRRKVLSSLSVKPEILTPAQKSGLTFETEWHDHCETPFEAYRDIEPVLFQLAMSLGLSKAALRIYGTLISL